MDPKKSKELLTKQIKQIDFLRTEPRFSSRFKAWKDSTLRILTNIWGSNSLHVKQFDSIHYSLMAFTTSTPESRFDEAFQNGLNDAQATLESFLSEIQELGLENKGAPTFEQDIIWLNNLYSKLNIVIRQLKRRHDERETLEVNDEYDLQDLMHVLLKLRFDDIRPEEWTPSYCGGSARMDFLLKEKQIVIETKLARKTLRDREVGNQLIEDIARYKEHPDCSFLSCFVYDPEGLVSNPSGLEKDLSKVYNGFRVDVRIEPRQ